MSPEGHTGIAEICETWWREEGVDWHWACMSELDLLGYWIMGWPSQVPAG